MFRYEYKIEMMHLVSCDSAMSVGRKFGIDSLSFCLVLWSVIGVFSVYV